MDLEELYKEIFSVEEKIKEKQKEYDDKHSREYAWFGVRKQNEIDLLNIALDEYRKQIPMLEQRFIAEWDRLLNEAIESFKQELNVIRKGVIPEIEHTKTAIPDLTQPMMLRVDEIVFKPCKIATAVPCNYSFKKEDKSE